MNWLKLSQIVLEHLVKAQVVTEKLKVPGVKKWEVIQETVVDEFGEHSKELANHPKVLAAAKNVNDAAVAFHNTVAEVNSELQGAKPQ